MSKVFVLGAGASKGLDPHAPLMDELSEEIFKLARTLSSNVIIKNFQIFIDDFYPHLSKDGWLPIEHLLSTLDISISEDRPLSSKYKITKLQSVRNSILYAMLRVIREKLSYDWNIPEDVRDFVERFSYISSFWGCIEKGDALISLNYDLIADNFLLDALRHNEILPQPITPTTKSNISIDYGFFPRFAFSPHGQQRYVPDFRIPLLKLHGSLNWLFCPSCQAIDVTEGSKGTIVDVFENKKTCPKCGTHYEPVIITPTLLKQYRNPLLIELWRNTEDILRHTDEIVFVGYSFPDADIALRTMFARAIYMNKEIRRRAKLTSKVKITVVDWVDPQKQNLAKPPDPYLRYIKNFGSIEYDWTGFRKFIERGCQASPVSFRTP